MTEPIYTCLWFDGQAKAAAEFYCSIFENSRIVSENPTVVVFELNSRKYMGLNGGPQFKPNEATSFVVNCATQNEIDRYWDALVADGGAESMCGWLRDKFGFSWQIVPAKLGEWMSDAARGGRVMALLLTMKKLDIEKLKNA